MLSFVRRFIFTRVLRMRYRRIRRLTRRINRLSVEYTHYGISRYADRLLNRITRLGTRRAILQFKVERMAFNQ